MLFWKKLLVCVRFLGESVELLQPYVDSSQDSEKSSSLLNESSLMLKQGLVGRLVRGFFATTFLSEAELNLILLTGSATCVTLRSWNLRLNESFWG